VPARHRFVLRSFALLTLAATSGLRAQEARQAERLSDLVGIVQAGFNHDASRIVTHTAGGTVGIWDATTGAPIAGDLGRQTSSEGFLWSPDARLVLIGAKSSAQVFDVTSAAALSPVLEFPWRADSQPCAVFSPNGKVLVALEDEAATVFAVAGGQRLARLAIPLRGEDDQSGLTPAAVFGANDAHCWFLDRTGAVTRYDAQTWQPLGAPLHHPRAPLAYDFGFAVSDDGRWLATFDSPGENGPKAHLQIWDIAKGKALGKPFVAVNGLEGRFIPGQARVFIAPGRGEATIRELPSLKTSAVIRPHDEVEGPSGQISPDGKWLLSWGSDRIVRLLDAANGKVKDSQLFGATITQVLMLPDSSGAILVFDNSAFFLQEHHDHYLVRLRFPETKITHSQRFTTPLRHTALSPDGRGLLVLVGEPDHERLIILDAATLQAIKPPHP